MTVLWLWVLIVGLVSGLVLGCWGTWWLWRRVMAVGHELEHLLSRLEEVGDLLDEVDLSPLDERPSSPGGRDQAW